jgi:hypothetical protein
VQADVRERLADALTGVEVRVSVPDPMPLPFVLVRREGGARADVLNDRAGIGVDVWAETEAEASSLAMRVSDEIMALPLSAGYSHTAEEVLKSEYDPDRNAPHWYGSYTINCYKPHN